jgi:hypothetical protein
MRNSDKVIRIFYHPEYGEVIGTRNQFRNKFKENGTGVNAIVQGTRKTHKGWKHLGEYSNV